MEDSSAEIFEPVVELPDRAARRKYDALVGLDDVKERLAREAVLLLDPGALQRWSETTHGQVIPAVHAFNDRSPMFVFGGDVGTGKSALAETFGVEVADRLGAPVFVYRLSLAARGTGLVGEITTLIRDAFAQISVQAARSRRGDGAPSSAYVLVIDEADAIAQSRASTQMHHEDRAGVNAVIRGLDSMSAAALPVLVVMCTNRLNALDPAVRRRAAQTFEFGRPSAEQRQDVLARLLDGTGLSAAALRRLAQASGPAAGRDYGHTYSDLVQRVVPGAVLSVMPDRPLREADIAAAIASTDPTPAFGQPA